MAPKSIALVVSLDTKGAEASFLKDLIQARGHRVILVDIGTGGEAAIEAEYTSKQVAELGGGNIAEIRKMKDTVKTSATMIAGTVRILMGALNRGELDGILAFGGASNTMVITTVLQSLPFGIPKFVLSSVAGIPAYASQYFGTKDIAILHSIVDVAGLNPIVKDLMKRTAGAICGMVEMQEKAALSENGPVGKGLIALTEFKFSDKCCTHVRNLLEERGFVVVPFHAQGVSDRAMEELMADGLFDAVIDIVPAGVSEELLGGNRAAGPNRLEIAGKMALPQIIAPCGFDMLSCGPIDRGDKNDPLWVSRYLKKRKLVVSDNLRVQARTTSEELKLVAREVARKLSMARGPVTFLIPQRSWSSLSEKGMELHDPGADRAFVQELGRYLHPRVRIVEVDLDLNTNEFAALVVSHFLSVHKHRDSLIPPDKEPLWLSALPNRAAVSSRGRAAHEVEAPMAQN